MPDAYASITALEDVTVLERLVEAMEVRAAQPAQQAILESYLAEVDFPDDATVLEVGCGSGAIARVLARRPGVGEVTGVDPSPYFIARARELAGEVPRLAFAEADGRALPFERASFDAVVVHTVLSHVPEPEAVIGEAHRVLRSGGTLAAFDGDYATTTVALASADPLQTCIEAALEGLVNDRWVIRRLPRLAAGAGFDVRSFRSHGYVETGLGYIMTVVERGADLLAAPGHISPALATALKDEARRRVDDGSYFAHIAYASLIAEKP
jgi:ubiquinone/menaquinone biosynthesis C-methylase UbiE